MATKLHCDFCDDVMENPRTDDPYKPKVAYTLTFSGVSPVSTDICELCWKRMNDFMKTGLYDKPTTPDRD